MLRISSLTILSFIIFGCKSDSDLQVICHLPSTITESSAVEIVKDSPLIWTIEDKNNDNILYGFDTKGKLQQQIKIVGSHNNDWEDLTSDENGNMYIGDFGNNNNDRKNLQILKINKNDLSKKDAKPSQITSFYYPEQKDFPPKKSNRIFDAEAFFEWKGNFYLFSKNRSTQFDGTVSIYKIPNKSGHFKAEKISTWKSCDAYKTCAITSADISYDGKKMVLLSADKVWLFSNYSKDDFTKGTISTFNLNHYSQKEGVCFATNQTLYITDEKSKHGKSYLYQFTIPKQNQK